MKFCSLISLFYTIQLFVAGRETAKNNVSQNDVGTKVVGGEEAVPHEFPFLVEIVEYINGPIDHMCSGTIINSGWILTTAVCTLFYPTYRHEVIAGIHNRVVLEKTAQRRDVIYYHLHPRWNLLDNSNDLAVFRIFPDLEINEFVSPAELVLESGFIPTELARIVGWGAETKNGPESNVVLKAMVGLTPKVDCNATYGNDLSENVLCYGGEGTNSCGGDAGGPVLAYPSGKVIGVISSSQCESPFPSINTELAPLVDWVYTTTFFHQEDETPVILQTDICGGAFGSNTSSGRIDFFSKSTFPQNTKCTWSISTSLSQVRFRIISANEGTRDDIFVTQHDPITRRLGSTIPIASFNADITADGPIVFLTLNGAAAAEGFIIEFYAKGYISEAEVAEIRNIHLSKETDVESYNVNSNDERGIYILNPYGAKTAIVRWRYIDLRYDDPVNLYAWKNNSFVLVEEYSQNPNFEHKELPEFLGLIIFLADRGWVSNNFSFSYYTELRKEDAAPALLQIDTCGGYLNTSLGTIDYYTLRNLK